MKQDEKHALERMAILLEEASAHAYRQSYGIFNPGWSRKTGSALMRAARTLRRRLEEE